MNGQTIETKDTNNEESKSDALDSGWTSEQNYKFIVDLINEEDSGSKCYSAQNLQINQNEAK